MPALTIATPSTQNRKLGLGVAATYRPVGETCPSSCPHLGRGCYAQKGLVKFQERKALDKSDDLERLLLKRAPLVRLNVSGDFGKGDKFDTEYFNEVLTLARLFPRTTFFAYTHFHAHVRANYTPSDMPKNFHLILSDEGPKVEGCEWRTARVIDDAKDRRANEVLCPYDKQKREGVKPTVSCTTCRMCFERKENIAFLKH